MYYHEIKNLFGIPETHPFVSVVGVDPADHCAILSVIGAIPGLKLLRTLGDMRDELTMFVGCTSREARDAFEHRAI